MLSKFTEKVSSTSGSSSGRIGMSMTALVEPVEELKINEYKLYILH